MAISHDGRFNELITPNPVPDSLDMPGDMFAIKEMLIHMFWQFFHCPQIEQSIASIMNMPSSEVVRQHLLE